MRQPLAIEQVIEVGNIFKLGPSTPRPLGAMYLDEAGKEQPIVMGTYGIGPARIAAAAIEQSPTTDGIVWPAAIAPFDVWMVVDRRRGRATRPSRLARRAARARPDVLVDDRDEQPGRASSPTPT